MSAPHQQKFNDDLVLTDEDRKLAAVTFPALFEVLDFPELRDLFASYDVPANRLKKRLRRAGLATIVLGVAALLGASVQPLYDQLPQGVANGLIIGSAAAGILSLLISTFGVLDSHTRARWLEARLMTERLRQFQFQLLTLRIPTILGLAKTPQAKEKFLEARRQWLSSFRMEYEHHLPGKLKEIVTDDAEDQFLLHQNSNLDTVDENDPLLAEVFSAYRLLRMRYQIQYLNYKLSANSVELPRRQVSLLSGISLVCILIVFFAHFAISISFVNSWLAFVRSAPTHVLVIWTAIIALAARTFEEGLQPTREVERYTAHVARLNRLLAHFDETPKLTEKVRVMTEVERIMYQEMRDFLKTNYEARFVL